MPDVKYIFRAEDRTASTIARIRRRIRSLGGRSANIRLTVKADGLDAIKREIEGLRDRTVRVDYTLGEKEGLPDIPETDSVKVDYTLGEKEGLPDIPETDSVKVDYTLGEKEGLPDIPETDSVKVDYTLGEKEGLPDIPETDSVKVDYTLGSTPGVQDIPESKAIRIDYVLGDTPGVQDIPESKAIRIDYVLGDTPGVQDIPESKAIRIDYVLGDTPGVQDIPESKAIRIDYVLGDTPGVQDIPESKAIRIDYVLGDTPGVQDIPESKAIRIDYVLGDTPGVQDIPESKAIRIDYVLGDTPGVQDIPESKAIRIDYVLGDTPGVQDIPESKAIRIDYVLGDTPGVQDIPESKAIRIDYVLGDTPGVQDIPESKAIRIDYVLGDTPGVQDIPESKAIRIDYVLGDTPGVQDIPESKAIRIDYVLGDTPGVQDIPESKAIRIDYVLGDTPGVQDIPESKAIRIDYVLGDTPGVQDIPESKAIRIDYVLGSTPGVQDIPESKAIRIDYVLGDTPGVQDIPESKAIRIDYVLGDTPGVQDIPESKAIRIDYVLGDTPGVQDIPESKAIRIDYVLGDTPGVQDIPESKAIRIDYVLGDTPGVQDIPESKAIRIDYVLGDTPGLIPLKNLGLSGTAIGVAVNYGLGETAGLAPIKAYDGKNISVTVDAVAGSTVQGGDLATQPAGQPGGEDGAAPGGGGGVGALAKGTGVVAGAVLLSKRITNIATALEGRWMDQEQALADLSAVASGQFGGQELSADQKAAAMSEAQRISQKYDISTGQALGVMYRGVQQGRTFDQMTGGGLTEKFVQAAQAGKGPGMSTLDALPYVVEGGTDVLDVLKGSLDERMQEMQTLQLGWVLGGKGDITNFGLAHGTYSGATYGEGWSPMESMAMMLTGLPAFNRVGSAATGLRNIIRDVQTGQGRDKWMEAATAAGFVDESGQLSLLNEQGQVKPPLELMEELRKFNDPAIASQRSRLMFQMFTVEAKQFIDYLLATNPEAKYAQSLELMGVVDAGTMADIKTGTASGGAAVLEGRRRDAMSQMWQLLGGPALTAGFQYKQHRALDRVQRIFDYKQVYDALKNMATPEMFGFFQERGLTGGQKNARGRTVGGGQKDDYNLRFPFGFRTEEKLEGLKQLLAEARSYQQMILSPIVTPAWEYGGAEPGAKPAAMGPSPGLERAMGKLEPIPLPSGWELGGYEGAAEGIAAFLSMLTGILDATAGASVEVRARVTELDTSAVENQIINIGARLALAVPGGEIAGGSGTVKQDRSTQERNSVNTSIFDSRSQRTGGAGG